jgi:hypothetical protein
MENKELVVFYFFSLFLSLVEGDEEMRNDVETLSYYCEIKVIERKH